MSQVLFHCFQVKEFLNRFASIPDLLELDHLTVSGDVTFGKNVSLKVSILHPLTVYCLDFLLNMNAVYIKILLSIILDIE